MLETRWKQRFDSYLKALKTLDAAMALAQERKLSTLKQQGLIQGFEYTHELAWNVFKDYLEYQGIFGLVGSRDATRSAFKNGLIKQTALIIDRTQVPYTPPSAPQPHDANHSKSLPALAPVLKIPDIFPNPKASSPKRRRRPPGCRL